MSWLIGTDVDIDAVRAYWPTCDEVDPETLQLLLVSARVQCETFAPDLVPVVVDGVPQPVVVPDTYRHAQALQARALYRAGMVRADDGIGPDGLAITTFPMDWTVKALLRPAGKPVIR